MAKRYINIPQISGSHPKNHEHGNISDIFVNVFLKNSSPDLPQPSQNGNSIKDKNYVIFGKMESSVSARNMDNSRYNNN